MPPGARPRRVHTTQLPTLSFNTNGPSVTRRLFEEGYAFDFFQAVRLLERIAPARTPVGRGGPPENEVVRFRALPALTFPASSIYELLPPSKGFPVPTMFVTFLGLFGPSGILPRHYTELLIRQEREVKGPERTAFRAWLDLFNHRLIALFYRAWEKYRFYIPYERQEYIRQEPDAFTQALFSFIGLGTRGQRNRLMVSYRQEVNHQYRERILARIDDFSLLYFSGFLSHRPRCAVALEAMLQEYFQLTVRVRQFQGQWLRIDEENQSRLGPEEANNLMGVNLVAGDRVWDVQNKIRIRLGPLRYARFNEFLPDRTTAPGRKAFFLISHLVRLYVGQELDFDVQLVLKAEDVPRCQLSGQGGAQLGWNTWCLSRPMTRDAEDAVFEGEDMRWITPAG